MGKTTKLINTNITGIKYTMIFSFFMLLLTPFFLKGQDKQYSVPVFSVLKYGAVGDGKTLDTDAIQKAINKAAKTGNGARVLVPAGHKYLIGT
ncbi:MAG: glycosyl hydrolase family 28-related protein, partial [Ignavibacteriaceae bacterium]